MITTYYVSQDFEKRAREMRPDARIIVDRRLLGDNWYSLTGQLPMSPLRMPKLPPGWVEEGKAIDGK